MNQHSSLWYIAALGLASVLFISALCFNPSSTNDLWLQIKIGEILAEEGALPRTVLFSFTQARDFPFVAHEWLPSWVFYRVFSWVGYDGLTWFKLALLLLLSGLGLGLARQVRANWVGAFLAVSFAVAVLHMRAYLRPEIFAYLCFIGQLSLYLRYAETGRLRWLVGTVPVTLLWVNSHGSYLVNLGLPGLFACGLWIDRLARTRTLRWSGADRGLRIKIFTFLAWSLVGCLGTLVNPNGMDLIAHSLQLSTDSAIKAMVAEWLPLTADHVVARRYLGLYLAAMLLLGSLVAAGRTRWSGVPLTLLATFALLPLSAGRHISFFALASIIPFASLFPELSPRRKRWVCIVASIALSLAAWGIWRWGNLNGARPGIYENTPLSQSTLQWIDDSGRRGNVLNSYKFGGQLVHSFYPRMLITVDSRIDAYGGSYMIDYFRLFRTDSPDSLRKFLDAFPVTTMILTPSDFAAIDTHRKFLRRRGWKKLRQSNFSVILGR